MFTYKAPNPRLAMNTAAQLSDFTQKPNGVMEIFVQIIANGREVIAPFTVIFDSKE